MRKKPSKPQSDTIESPSKLQSYASQLALKAQSYTSELARAFDASLAVYLLESAVIVIAAVGLSLFDLGWTVDLVVLFLFLLDVGVPPEKSERVKVMWRRALQGFSILVVSYLVADTLGEAGSGLLVFFLALYLNEPYGNWLEKRVKRLDKWLTKKGLPK